MALRRVGVAETGFCPFSKAEEKDAKESWRTANGVFLGLEAGVGAKLIGAIP